MNEITGLIVFGVVGLLLKALKQNMNLDSLLSQIGKLLMTLPRPLMMIIMALPEQLVLLKLQPKLPLLSRLLVSVSMYLIHFAYNGMVMKPKKSYDELVWIIGTALYALHVIGVKQTTAIALIAADSVMTLALRGMA